MIAITARGLWARKRRLVATLLAVGLGVAFLAGTLLLSDTLRANFDRLFTQADSGTDVVLRGATQIGSGNATRTGVDASLLPRVRAVSGVADAQPFVQGYGQLLGRDGKPIGGNGPPTQAANWVGDPALNPYRLVAGHAPRAADEVVINRGAAMTGHLALGMTTTLLTPQPLRVHIVGIATFGTVLNLGVTAGSLGAVGSGSFAVSAAAAADRHWRVGSTVPVVYPDGAHARLRVAAIFGHPDITGDYLFAAAGWAPHAGQALDSMVLIKLKPGAAPGPARAAVTAAIAGTGQPRVQDRAQYEASATGAVNTILGLVYVMLALAILIALMGVANTLSLSIHERTRELGLLRALGQTRAQARGMVRWESAIIAMFGTLGGVILGTFTGWAVVQSSSGPSMTVFAAPPLQLVLFLVLGAVTGILAGLRPARRAARQNMITAIATA